MSTSLQKHKDLKCLIKSLKKTEKKFVKLYSRVQKGDKCYIFIFDFLDKRIKTDDETLKQALRKAKILTDKIKDPDAFIRASKGYTYKYIMSVLRLMYNKQGEEERKAKAYFTNAHIYLEKFGVKAAHYELEKAITIFKKYEKHLNILEVSRLQLSLEQTLGDKASLVKCDSIYEQINQRSDLITLENFFNNLRARFYIHYRNHARGKYNQLQLKELKVLLEHPSFNLSNANKSFRTQIAYYMILGYYSLISNRTLKAQLYFKKILAIWKNKNHFITEQPNEYTALLSNYLNLSINTGNLSEDFGDYLHLLKLQKPQTLDGKLNQQQEVLFLQLRYYMALGKLHKVQNTINEIKKSLPSFINILPASRKISFYYNISIFYFIMEEFHEASEYIQKWYEQEQKSEHRIDLQTRWKYLELVIELELNNEVDTFKRVGSISNHIRHKKMLGELELIIMRYLLKIGESFTKREKKYQMRLFYNTLESYKSTIEKDSISGLGIIEIQIWLESRINNQKMYEVYTGNQQAKYTQYDFS